MARLALCERCFSADSRFAASGRRAEALKIVKRLREVPGYVGSQETEIPTATALAALRETYGAHNPSVAAPDAVPPAAPSLGPVAASATVPEVDAPAAVSAVEAAVSAAAPASAETEVASAAVSAAEPDDGAPSGDVGDTAGDAPRAPQEDSPPDSESQSSGKVKQGVLPWALGVKLPDGRRANVIPGHGRWHCAWCDVHFSTAQALSGHKMSTRHLQRSRGADPPRPGYRYRVLDRPDGVPSLSKFFNPLYHVDPAAVRAGLAEIDREVLGLPPEEPGGDAAPPAGALGEAGAESGKDVQNDQKGESATTTSTKRARVERRVVAGDARDAQDAVAVQVLLQREVHDLVVTASGHEHADLIGERQHLFEHATHALKLIPRGDELVEVGGRCYELHTCRLPTCGTAHFERRRRTEFTPEPAARPAMRPMFVLRSPDAA